MRTWIVAAVVLSGCAGSPIQPSSDARTFVLAEETLIYLNLGPTAQADAPWLEVRPDGHVLVAENHTRLPRTGRVWNELELVGVCQAGTTIPCRHDWRP